MQENTGTCQILKKDVYYRQTKQLNNMNNFVSPYPRQIFVFGHDQRLGNEIAKLLKLTPAGWTMKKLPDGERIPHQTETVRDHDVFVIFDSQHGDEQDYWYMNYLRFIRALKDGSPNRITVVLPKLLHQRQEVENSDQREPELATLFPEFAEVAGADRMIVCRIHNPAAITRKPKMNNVPTDILLAEEIEKRHPDLSGIAIASADIGGAAKARETAGCLGGLPVIIVEKNRNAVTNESKPMLVFYDPGSITEDIHTVIFVDDLMSTFNTCKRAADAVAEQFSHIKNYKAVATHADFIIPETHSDIEPGKNTLENIINSRFDSIWVTNTVPVSEKTIQTIQAAGKELHVISVALGIAQTIDNMHNGASVSELWKTRKK